MHSLKNHYKTDAEICILVCNVLKSMAKYKDMRNLFPTNCIYLFVDIIDRYTDNLKVEYAVMGVLNNLRVDGRFHTKMSKILFFSWFILRHMQYTVLLLCSLFSGLKFLQVPASVQDIFEFVFNKRPPQSFCNS